MAKLIYPPLDERAIDELPEGGFLQGLIEHKDKVYEIMFYSMDRVAYHISAEGGFIFEPAVMIFQHLSLDNVIQALPKAEEEGFFENLLPLTSKQIDVFLRLMPENAE